MCQDLHTVLHPLHKFLMTKCFPEFTIDETRSVSQLVGPPTEGTSPYRYNFTFVPPAETFYVQYMVCSMFPQEIFFAALIAW